MHVNRAVPPKPCLFTALFFNSTQVLLIHIFIFIPITHISLQTLLLQEDLDIIPYHPSSGSARTPIASVRPTGVSGCLELRIGSPLT
jgi:hypothetical protein